MYHLSDIYLEIKLKTVYHFISIIQDFVLHVNIYRTMDSKALCHLRINLTNIAKLVILQVITYFHYVK